MQELEIEEWSSTKREIAFTFGVLILKLFFTKVTIFMK